MLEALRSPETSVNSYYTILCGFTSQKIVLFTIIATSIVRITLRLVVYRQSVRLGAKPLESHDQYFFKVNTCGYSPYVTSSLTIGWVCHLQLLLVLPSAAIVGSKSCETLTTLNLEGQVPVFISPRNRVDQIEPQALGSLLVASYDPQCYGGGIRTRLHTGFHRHENLKSSTVKCGSYLQENTPLSLQNMYFNNLQEKHAPYLEFK
jgi:hypothetical protein